VLPYTKRSMRKIILIILLVSFTALYYFYKPHDDNLSFNNTISSVKKMFKNSTNTTSLVAIDQLGNQNASSNTGNPDSINSKANFQNFNSEQLQNWVKNEARALDSTNNNTREKQIELRAQAQTLSAPQIIMLQELAVNSKLAINDRILSAYIISLNASELSQEALFEVAKAQVPDFGPTLPHSEAELRHTQETAIRYMQIDELFQRSKTDTKALDKLKLLSQEAESAQIRSYAEKKYQEAKLL
jgi:hypothetical protein